MGVDGPHVRPSGARPAIRTDQPQEPAPAAGKVEPASSGASRPKDAFDVHAPDERSAPGAAKPESPSAPRQSIEQRARSAVDRAFTLASQGGREAAVSREEGREQVVLVRRDASGREVSIERATRDGEAIRFERADWTGQQIVRQRLEVQKDGTRVEVNEAWPSDEKGAATLEPPARPPAESRTEKQSRAKLPGGEIRERSEVVYQRGGEAAQARRSSEIVLHGDAVVSARQEIEDGAGHRVAAELEGGEVRVSVDGHEIAGPRTREQAGPPREPLAPMRPPPPGVAAPWGEAPRSSPRDATARRDEKSARQGDAGSGAGASRAPAREEGSLGSLPDGRGREHERGEGDGQREAAEGHEPGAKTRPEGSRTRQTPARGKTERATPVPLGEGADAATQREHATPSQVRSLPGFARMSPREQERVSLLLAALAGLASRPGGTPGDPRQQRLAALLTEPAIQLALSRALEGDSDAAALFEEGALATALAQGEASGRAELPTLPLWTPARVRAGGGWRIGRYQVVKKLGMGGMGEVFLVRAEGERGFEKTLVLKCILPHLADDEEFLERFLDEARLAARLNHPNVVQIFELGQAGGRWYMAMEHVDGADLRRVVARARARSQRIPLGVACRVGADVAAALEYAHKLADERGRPMRVVHRDVSPHNILVGLDGAVKLIDFGIAQSSAHASEAGSPHGKLGYMAPELLGGARASPSSDVFSLGVVLWELLAHRRLWDAPTEPAMMLQIDACEVPPPSSFEHVPAELDRICLRTLAKAPDKRFPDAASLRHALEAFAVAHRVDTTSSALERFVGAVLADDEPKERERTQTRAAGP